MHGTYISYCRRAVFGTSAPPLLSLRAAMHSYSPVPFIGCIGSSNTKLRSDRSADLKSLRWYSIGRLAGVGYMRIVHRVTQGKIFAFAPEMEELVRSDGVQISGNLNTRGKTSKRNLFATGLQNLMLMPHLDVCDPSDCRVAFISRGRPQEVASVASDASAVRWWHCRHRKTNRPTGSRWR
jgi:hypothetical protein